jgi:high-affinity iron transporter
VLGVLQRIQRADQARFVWMDAGVAAILSLAGGVGLVALGISFEGQAEQIFEGTAMLLAAAVLTWMIFWMGRQGRAIQVDLDRDVREPSSARGGWALFSLAFVAVLREGIELALFLTAAALTTTAGATIVGGLIGLGAAAVAGWLLFATTSRLDLRTFLRVTSVLLSLVGFSRYQFRLTGPCPPEPAPTVSPARSGTAVRAALPSGRRLVQCGHGGLWCWPFAGLLYLQALYR